MAKDPRYPIGPHENDPDRTPEKRQHWIDHVRELPTLLDAAVAGLGDDQLDTPYRDGGWTIRQVVHHVADSHLNAYTRFRLAFTEDNPTIRPYDEKAWAELPDANSGDPGVSLALVRAIHERWVRLLDSRVEADFRRPLHHPEVGDMTVDDLLDQYQWHGRHHVAHITETRAANGW